MKRRTRRAGSVGALVGITLGLGLVNAGSAAASTPSGCSSVRQVGATKYVKYKGKPAASVKQYYGCGKMYGYLLIWDSFRKNHTWKYASVSVTTPDEYAHGLVLKNRPAYEMWSKGYATTNCTQGFGRVQFGDGANTAYVKTATVC
ncbi:hypothetical protein [Streptomyces sp. NPDC050355]|uniref:hypothetical protein n=1 Tax=Streptomyces sp. NPDC050355 TaxID=3365609 RepID=UPI0037A57138